MSRALIVLVVVLLVLVAWSLVGYFTSRAEQARYRVLRTAQGYELRRYAPRIEARVTITGSYREALSDGFRIIAGYIFGGNTARQSIAMTAPVVARQSQTIAMTAPVFTQGSTESSQQTIAFVMPATFTLETLPKPNDSRITLVAIPKEDIAVARFSWYASQSRVAAKQQALTAALARDGIAPIGEPGYAGYNPPWTPPWMLRNEVWVRVASSTEAR